MLIRAPEFRIGDVFPADNPKKVAVVRLVIAAQSLISVGRLLGDLLPETPAYRETKHYFMLFSLGMANEAAAAFLAAQHAGVFEDLLPFPDEEMNARFEQVVAECDRDNPESLRSKLVAYGRNKLSFHWEEGAIKKSLASIAALTLPAWSGGEDQTPVTTALPIAEAVTITALGLRVGDREALNNIMGDIAAFQGNLLHVSHAVYAITLGQSLRGNRAGEKA